MPSSTNLKDARGIDVKVGDFVAFAQRHELQFGNWSTMSWGIITKINKKMVRVDVFGVDTNKYPHNLLVCEFPNIA